jgi:hypothetical protein
MWVFDGEEWINEGASESEPKRPIELDRDSDPNYPELQIVKILPAPQKRERMIPPFPLP